MNLEHKSHPVLPLRLFIKRLLRFALYSLSIITISLSIGVIGYWYFGNLSLLDSFLNASMILTGMGPVDRMISPEGKIFASFYALYSGVAFLSTVGVLFTPVFHRILHILHLDIKDR